MKIEWFKNNIRVKLTYKSRCFLLKRLKSYLEFKNLSFKEGTTVEIAISEKKINKNLQRL